MTGADVRPPSGRDLRCAIGHRGKSRAAAHDAPQFLQLFDLPGFERQNGVRTALNIPEERRGLGLTRLWQRETAGGVVEPWRSVAPLWRIPLVRENYTVFNLT